jgi:parallel beta-helix repeat protein
VLSLSWKNKNFTSALLLALSILCVFCFITPSEAHILVIGDSNSDLPSFYAEAVQLSTDLKAKGYPVVELYRENATSENILKGMYNADAVIYVGHGGYLTGHYDMNGGIATPPFALVGSDNFVWGIGDKIREGWNSNLFYAPFKSDIPVFLLHACFSTGWVEDKQVANPIETIYNFAHMFTGAGANYYATAWNGAEIIYDFLNGAANFQVANNQNYEKIVTSTLYNDTLVWRNNNGYAAFVGNWSGTFPTVAQTTAYNDTAAEVWYNGDRQLHQLTCNFSVNPTTIYSGQLINFTDNSTDIGGIIITYFWDFGDGTTSNAINPTHLYNTPGNYLVNHRVTDDHGLLAETNLTIPILGNNSMLYVNSILGNDTWDGTSPTWISGLMGPLKTIITAINKVTEGGTVNVAPGTYTENLDIYKKVKLTGNSSDDTYLVASSSLNPVIYINNNGNNSTIQNFNISGLGSAPVIFLDGADNCNILNNTISNGSVGVVVNGNNNTVSSNEIRNNKWAGVDLDSADNNQIQENTISENQEGVYVQKSASKNTIQGNNITNNSYSGVALDGSSDNNIKDNQINGNSNGVRLYNATGNRVSNNNVSDNSWGGVVGDNAHENIIDNNSISRNVEGVHLMNNSTNNTIINNNLTGNSTSWCGISLWNSISTNLTNNTISGMQEGVYITQSASYNTVTQNNIIDNLNSAICMDGNSQYNNIHNNINISRNGNGIRLYQVTENTINNNNITNSNWAAICLDNASRNTVLLNTISSNQEGIYVFNNANYNIISNNTSFNNAYSGICVNNAINNTVIWNNIASNGNGVRLYNYANQNNLTYNDVTGHGWAGIVMDGSYQNQLHFNTIQNNGYGIYSMSSSSNNQIYQNNFINNTASNSFEDGTTNTYDNGLVGNYWNDYGGSGSYLIQFGNVDNHPSLTQF